MSDEWFEDEDFDDEYINDENDPEKVLIVPADDYVTSDNEEVVKFDEVFETVRCAITNLSKYDHMMEKKVLDALRSGTLK